MNKLFYSLFTTIIFLLLSCDKTPSSKVGFNDLPQEEVEFIAYFEKNRDNLDPIEGVYIVNMYDTIYNKTINNDLFSFYQPFNDGHICYVFKSKRIDGIPYLYDITLYQRRKTYSPVQPLLLPVCIYHPIGGSNYKIRPVQSPYLNILSINRCGYEPTLDIIDSSFKIDVLLEDKENYISKHMLFHKHFPL